jgi:hypothetical protein
VASEATAGAVVAAAAAAAATAVVLAAAPVVVAVAAHTARVAAARAAVAAAVAAAATVVAVAKATDLPGFCPNQKAPQGAFFYRGSKLGLTLGPLEAYSCCRRLRARPANSRSKSALGSHRITDATTPICHGITRNRWPAAMQRSARSAKVSALSKNGML